MINKFMQAQFTRVCLRALIFSYNNAFTLIGWINILSEPTILIDDIH